MKFTEYTQQTKGSWFKFKEGANRVRIVSEYEEEWLHFISYGTPSVSCTGKACETCREGGKPSKQHKMWVINRANDTLEILTAGVTIMDALKEYSIDEDYKFNSLTGLPDYDITINKTTVDKKVKYTVVPRPKTPLTTEEKAKIKELMPIKEILEKINSKRMQEEVKEVFSEKPEEELEDLPF